MISQAYIQEKESVMLSSIFIQGTPDYNTNNNYANLIFS